MSKVQPCQCRDCMELTHADNGLCHDCEDAGCIRWDGECLAELWANEAEWDDELIPPNAGSSS